VIDLGAAYVRAGLAGEERPGAAEVNVVGRVIDGGDALRDVQAGADALALGSRVHLAWPAVLLKARRRTLMLLSRGRR
jgi:hypothetical protein